MESNRQKYLFIAFTVIFFSIFLSFNFISKTYLTYLWFESQELTTVWWKTWQAETWFYFIGFVVSLIGYYLSYFFGRFRLKKQLGVQGLAAPLRFVYLGTPIFLALAVHGASFEDLWQVYVLAGFAPDFGVKDPILGHDASFYMFQIDWYESLLNWAKVYLVLNGFYALSLYILPLQGLDLEANRERVKGIVGTAVPHVAIVVGLFVLVLSCGALLGKYSLIFDGSSSRVAGASYTDVNARMMAYSILAYVGIVLALVIIASGFVRNWRLPAMGAVGWLVLYLLLIRMYPALVQSISVNPNEQNAEKIYIENSIKYTRIGYGLDNVQKTKFDARGAVTAAMIKRNPTIIKNIRLWDYRPIQNSYKQLQELKPYYEFADVDIDRYQVNGEPRQVMLSARELNANDLPDQSQSWIQTHLQYTHGYGLVLSPTNRVTAEGQPELWVKNFPPVSSNGLPTIKQPGIYFGELTREYAVVNTAMSEIDYPQENKFAETKYSGKGGVELGSGLRKLLISWQFDTWKLLISREVKPDSRLLFNRRIQDMVRTLAPFLMFDRDPYLVMGKDGKLYWIIDAYTTSSKFPYSQRFNQDVYNRIGLAGKNKNYRGLAQTNYIRNSVKITVDAYDGTVKMYRFDESDPIIQAWSKFLPDLFQPIDKMPEFLRRHLRYPEMMFLLQAGIYADYHMDGFRAFYNKEDRWEIAREIYDQDKQRPVQPYYTVIKMPGEKTPEYILMLPFVPKSKQNLVAWLAVRCDYRDPAKGIKNRYGEITVLDFPRSRQLYGTMQIESRISQNTDISKDFSLWNQQGSRVLRGNLLIYPIENALLYIEPVYLQSTQSPFPELKRVIAADATGVHMRDDLGSALSSLTRGRISVAVPGGDKSGGDSGEPISLDPARLSRNALSAMRRARTEAGKGNWEGFGKNMREVEDILKRMSQKK